MLSRLRSLGPGALAGLFVLALIIAGQWAAPRVVEFAQLRVFDLYQQLAPAIFADRRSVVIDIDEASLAESGQWPWPRHVVAELVRKISAATPASVGFDIVFAEPDGVSPRQLPRSLAGLAPDLAERLAGLPDTDALLADVIRGAPIVLGEASARNATIPARPRRATSIAPLGGTAPVEDALEHLGTPVRNIEPLEAAAAGIGAFTVEPEEDGIVRRVPALVFSGTTITPTLAIEMLRVATGTTTLPVRTSEGGTVLSVLVGDTEIPTDAKGRLWIRYAKHDPSLYIPAKDILAGRVDPARLESKFVFIGTSATGLLDIKTTPLDRIVPGVELHAMVLDALIDGALLVRPDWAVGMERDAMAIIGLLLILVGARVGALPLALLLVSLCAAAAAASFLAFVRVGLLFDAAYPIMAWLLTGITLGFVNFMREEKRRHAIRGMFSRYVAPALVEKLVNDPNALRLGGELREVTIMFCDVRGFTAMSERLGAEALITLMNRYFTPMAGAVLDNDGTIDKYIGDAIMALWNAPIPDPDHRRKAARAALEMRRRLERLNDELAAEAMETGVEFMPLRVGIGINSGACAAGHIGAQQRLEYSVLGDAVNLAARLESQSLRYGLDILLSDATRSALADFALLELDLVLVKGKSEPIRIYALVGDERTANRPDFIRLQSFHSDLLQCYRSQQWPAARKLAQECRALASEFGLRRVYKKFLQRIDSNEHRQLPSNWDGIHVAERK